MMTVLEEFWSKLALRYMRIPWAGVLDAMK
jgi:hypothetical protein